MAGRDLMACAQSGSGKTAAFCFPIISGVLTKCVERSQSNGGDGWTVFPRALILSPTRELTSQIFVEAGKFAYQSGAKMAVVYGGAPMGQQLRDLERGVDILVATPERLVDMIERSRVSLKMIKYLALDEADRMLDMGFEPQRRKIVQRMSASPRCKSAMHDRNKKAMELIAKGWSALKEVDRVIDYCKLNDRRLIPLLRVKTPFLDSYYTLVCIL
ncbi:DEAD-box ATP-dependent RNA helicase 52B isoform X2 [Rosa chinensis]|uniref:DEAD-box ATP-dependent RNA helicase 52B isoform X2 n=1 Tax=Rosa chinensis TaxID=74649 RepID=UPI001AD8D6C2|nr:DEAD-box ATP-dependent RNA helicase 52B isoform X2 [Rosa chinensis]